MFIKRKLEKYLNEHLYPKEKTISIKSKKSANYDEMTCLEDSVTYERTAMSETFTGTQAPSYSFANISDFIERNKKDDTFQTLLFKYIDDRGLKDSEVYNKVNIDRRLFSKIRSDINYHPSKETIILLGIALELNEQEIEELLTSASYSLPMNTTYDLIIRFCFKEKIYNLNTINEFLFDHNCKTLNT